MNGRPLPSLPYLAQLRRRVRAAEYKRTWPNDLDRAGCAVMSEVLSVRYGVQEDGGCYVIADEDGHAAHAAHSWNVLPSGQLLDTTADQFHDEDLPHGIRIAEPNDPRYDADCDGDTCWLVG